jgi:hypothetical protein
MTGRVRASLASALVLIAYVALADGGLHHWHEWRYLYSAAHYSVPELAQGLFDAYEPPLPSRVEVGSWYWGQLGHEYVLRALVLLLGPGLSAIIAMLRAYGAAVVLALACISLALRCLPLAVPALQVGWIALLSPVAVYLGFKLLAEVPALLGSCAAILLLCTSLRATPLVALTCTAGAGVALAAATLSMPYVTLLYHAFALSAFVVLGRELGRGALAGRFAATATIALALVWFALHSLGLGLDAYATVYHFYRLYVKSLALSLFGVGMAYTGLYLVLPLALLSQRRTELAFFGLWAAAALLPVFLLSTNYMEARYLCVALPALAGLLALGFEVAAERLLPQAAARRWPALAVPAVALVSWISLPITHHEMSHRELVRTVEAIWRSDPDASILVPWNYTDFHFLKVAFPDRSVLLVQSAFGEDGRIVRDVAWEERRQQTYGPDFVRSEEELRRSGRPLYYVGYETLPPIRRLQAIGRTLGIGVIERSLAAMKPRNHLAGSWMWNDPLFVFTAAGGEGEYRAYHVRFSR